jgi:cell division protein DivIC
MTDYSQMNNRASYRRRRMALMILAGILIWGGVTLWDQVGKSRAKAARLESVNAKLAEVMRQNEEAKREVARLNDDEYIEQKIRTELHWAKPGETIFFVAK